MQHATSRRCARIGLHSAVLVAVLILVNPTMGGAAERVVLGEQFTNVF